MILKIVLLIILFSVIMIFLYSYILMLTTKLFKEKPRTYWNTVGLYFVYMVIGWIVSFLLLTILRYNFYLSTPLALLAQVIFFLLFYLIFFKSRKVYWGKALAIYIVNKVFISVIVFAISFFIGIISAFYTYPYISNFIANHKVIIVEGNSMSPTYEDNDYFFVKIHPDNLQIKDAIIYYKPDDKDNSYIGRIIGLPNDKLEIKDGKVYINDEELEEDYVNGVTMAETDKTVFEIPEGYYFIMGDNREKSTDSRTFGPISVKDIFGKVENNFIFNENKVDIIIDGKQYHFQ